MTLTPDAFVCHRKVLWSDCDPAGVVYTGRFTYFALEAAEEFGESLLGGRNSRKTWAENLGTPAVNLELAYIKPLRPGDEIDIQIRVVGIDKKTFELSFDAVGSDGKLMFTAKLKLICVHSDVRKPVDMPIEMVSALKHWQS